MSKEEQEKKFANLLTNLLGDSVLDNVEGKDYKDITKSDMTNILSHLSLCFDEGQPISSRMAKYISKAIKDKIITHTIK